MSETPYPAREPLQSSTGTASLRVDAVIQREQNKQVAEKAKAADSVARQAEIAREGQVVNEELQNQQHEVGERIRESMQNEQGRQEEESSLFKRLLGGRQREAQRESERQQIEAARQKLAKLTGEKYQPLQEEAEQVRQDQTAAEQAAQHASEVADANTRGGSLETSREMKQALEQQDKTQQALREQAKLTGFYEENGYKVEKPELLMPLDMVDALMSRMREGDMDWSIPEVGELQRLEKSLGEMDRAIASGEAPQIYITRAEQTRQVVEDQKKRVEVELRKRVMDIAPFVEQALEWADERDIPVNRNTLMTAIIDGVLITQGGTRRESAQSLASYKAKSTLGSSDIGFYATGAAVLNGFFRERSSIKDWDRIPYILAFAAGANTHRSAGDMVVHLRDWLAESIPVPLAEPVYIDGQWVAKPSEPRPRGFDYKYTASYNNRVAMYERTKDPYWAEAVEQANDMASKVAQRLDARGRHTAAQKFRAGMWRTYDNGSLFPPVQVLKEQD